MTNSIDDATVREALAWIEQEAGIVVGPERAHFVRHRLAQRSGREDLIPRAGIGALLLEAVCTHETRLFRDLATWEQLQRVFVPRLRDEAAAGRREPVVRAWSAACSVGDEAYSLAALLRHALPGWRVEVLATDISEFALAQARTRRWPVNALDGLPAAWRAAFDHDPNTGEVRPGEAIRRVVELRHTNLLHARPPRAHFDLILCRNVLIYFRRALQRRVVGQLLDGLAPGGWFVAGESEGLSALELPLRRIGDGAYARREYTRRIPRQP
ncbi:MAG TPA: CheR family methyltransferase [Kofleriaceae bacterium]|nr:CheR family methyltransferase [Kofleriaceae bacterium]